jgi:hypothetical protein
MYGNGIQCHASSKHHRHVCGVREGGAYFLAAAFAGAPPNI